MGFRSNQGRALYIREPHVQDVPPDLISRSTEALEEDWTGKCCPEMYGLNQQKPQLLKADQPLACEHYCMVLLPNLCLMHLSRWKRPCHFWAALSWQGYTNSLLSSIILNSYIFTDILLPSASYCVTITFAWLVRYYAVNATPSILVWKWIEKIVHIVWMDRNWERIHGYQEDLYYLLTCSLGRSQNYIHLWIQTHMLSCQ